MVLVTQKLIFQSELHRSDHAINDTFMCVLGDVFLISN